jgi:hypothetical protein
MEEIELSDAEISAMLSLGSPRVSATTWEPPSIENTFLGMTQVAVRKALERMLEDYRVILVEEVGQTVGDESEIDGEITTLYQVFHLPV